MATEGPPHLTQEELSSGDRELLAELKEWIINASFNSENHICTDEDLQRIWIPKLCKSDIALKFPQPVFLIRRVHGSKAVVFTIKPPDTLKAHSVTAIRIIQGQPTISDLAAAQVHRDLPINVGSTTYISNSVMVTPAVDILVVTSQTSRSMDP